MQQLTGSQKGTEQLGVAEKEDTDERRPTQLLPPTTNGATFTKETRNVTVGEFKMHEEGQANGGEPNHKDSKCRGNAPRVMRTPQQWTRQIKCSETRDVSGYSKAVSSHNSCADQLHHFVQGRISLVLTLRLLAREMQSWGGCKDI